MRNKTILLVDDSPTEMKVMQTALQGKGFNLLMATDGEDALHKVLHQKPDVVLLDVVLPKKNGFQVCRQLKTAPETKATKVILVTSKSQDTDRFWGLKQGADEYLTKPINADELLAAIGRHL
ncbi:MAG: response regulator [Bryobacterales bacterium]|nr:response regulator [Bryobacterales bacterium]